jgi:murein DD-endopeptidase MepM/ murein hydrolase activator NlpD
MKKLYYFSEKSLNFLEVKYFKEKLITIFTISVILVSGILLGAIYFISNLSDKESDLKALRSENKQLTEKFSQLSSEYKSLGKELDSLTKISNDLRLATNLTPISPEERRLGIGGSTLNKNYLKFGSNVAGAINVADMITRKFEFEKAQFNEISSKLKQNKSLFASIPALLPAAGTYSMESFGMRVHPILGVNKMHNGIDIICDVGTNVKAAGKAKVLFVGRKGGYGLAVELDHGFGYVTIYGHLSKTLVKEGQTITRGQTIAKSGNTGLSSGPHLHYEVLHNGENLNPADFFFDEYSYFEAN